MASFEQHQRGPLKTVEWTSGGSTAERFVVFCHGFGASGTDLVGLGEVLQSALPPTRWVFPAALLEPVEMSDWGGRAWWPLRLAEMMERMSGQASDRELALRQLTLEKPDGIEAARDALASAIQEARNDFESIPFVLGGFSQGAMLAADVAVRQLAQPDALTLFSGCPIDSSDWASMEDIALPAVITHGRFDEVLPFRCGEMLEEKLAQQQGCEVTFVPFNGGHQIPQDALAAAAQLIASTDKPHTPPKN